ncbi:SMI1/KNR4 family protein [Streptomyces corynorhini]|uniref:SMI1/KNR4 family protein n=1 Tax=Streptomyces corynorhini TaxID=2282652 RepID=A0A370ANX8_9ACTN|nr:SMI1/KNR4 family protein [Streptomyces corynorhini]RDG31298.1 SMI1/KNR4 family protein [Streptomyces corynorhini]
MNSEYAGSGNAFRSELDALRAAFPPEHCLPPLGWEAVHTFEYEHGIVLPDPYRTLVAEICDGCPDGPADVDGLIPLAALPADWGCDQRQRVLAKPFPLTEAWVWEDDPRPYEEIEPLIDEVSNHGSVVLGTDGSGMYWHLVVTGAHRGRIWNISDVGAAPFGAAFGHRTEGEGFAGWVAHWATTRRPWFDVVV